MTFRRSISAPSDYQSEERDTIDLAIAKLESMNLDSNNARKQSGCKDLSRFELLRLLAILRFFRMVKNNQRSRIESSGLVAEVVFGKSGASYRARTIRDWADFFSLHSKLPLLRQGKYQKTKSLIDDEDVKSAVCHSYDQLELSSEQLNRFRDGLILN